MYKDKKKQKAAVRKAVAKHREGITPGITSDTTTIENTKKFLESEGVTDYETPTYPDIIDKLTDPVWRKRLEKICTSFNNSSANKADVYLGVPSEMFTIGGSNNKAYNLVEVCDLVEATR